MEILGRIPSNLIKIIYILNLDTIPWQLNLDREFYPFFKPPCTDACNPFTVVPNSTDHVNEQFLRESASSTGYGVGYKRSPRVMGGVYNVNGYKRWLMLVMCLVSAYHHPSM